MSVAKTIALSLASIMAISLAGLGVNLVFGRDVTLVVDGEPSALTVIYGSVADVLAREDVSIGPRDRVSHDLSEIVTDGMMIIVDYARPIDLTLDGDTGTYWTYSTTVAGVIDDLGLGESSLRVSVNRLTSVPRDGLTLTLQTGHDVVVTAAGKKQEVHAFGTVANALIELGLTWDGDDIITPDPSSILSDDLAITLIVVEQKTVVRDKDIPFKVDDTKDPKKPKGEVTVTTKGVKGTMKETVTQTLHDGKVVAEEVTNQEVIKQPITQVQTTGTKPADVLANVTPGSAQAIAYDQVIARGWSDADFQCLVNLWQKESGWRWNAENRYSGAYGIPQALPGSKMASAGSDWRTNPATQIKWGLGYIKGRYKTPCGAWNFFLSHGWY